MVLQVVGGFVYPITQDRGSTMGAGCVFLLVIPGVFLSSLGSSTLIPS